MENEIMEVEEMEINEVEETRVAPEIEETTGNGAVIGILAGIAAIGGVAALVWNSKPVKKARAEWNDKRREKQIAKLEKEGYSVSRPVEYDESIDTDCEVIDETEE